jgi:hypothetical protein
VLEYSSTVAVSGLPFHAEAVVGRGTVLAWRCGMKKESNMGTVLYRAAHEVGRSIVGVQVQGGTLNHHCACE